MALIGGLAAWIGLRKRDAVALTGGALGGLLAAIALRRVTLPHDTLAQAFGAEAIASALAELPAERRAHLLPARWGWRWPSEPEPCWTRDLAFWTLPDSDRQLLRDLWQPPEDVPPSGLAFIYLHGSGWRYLDKDIGTRPYFRHLAAQGHVVMDVAYRLLPEGDFFAQIGDAKRAIAWLKANAARYGVDPARIVIGGGSAGGTWPCWPPTRPTIPASTRPTSRPIPRSAAWCPGTARRTWRRCTVPTPSSSAHKPGPSWIGP